MIHLDSEKDVAKIAESRQRIIQKYILISRGAVARIRKIQEDKTYYLFTFKQEVMGKTLEIEKEITKEDYKMLSKNTIRELQKTRYNYKGWELDYLKNNNKTYIAVAEYEMPENIKNPPFIPEFIKNLMFYKIKLKDSRFSNKKLYDVKYAESLYRKYYG